jgi:2,4-dienoyl-CoA reductase-like NADH-dependent reductase (Old Yellow Enzyme family)
MAALGHNSAYAHLLSPFSIGRVNLRNRIVFQPHFTALGEITGMPSDDHRAYHEERARGGVGLIITESQAIHPSGKTSRRSINAFDPTVVPRLARIAEAVHRHGAKIFGQLTHGGHNSLEHPPDVLWAPTQMPEPSSHHTTKAMDAGDIDAVIKGFARTARHLVDAGFDGIEVKVAHDGLLRSFASPFFNRRKDLYGGSFDNRMRLPFEVLAAIKAEIGSDVPVGVRICVDEFTPFGYNADYGLRMAKALQDTGNVDYFNSDAGSFSSFWMEIPPAAVEARDFDRINVALKRASRLPVIAFGRLTPQRGEALIAAGEADLIGMARQLIADPETPNKLASGRGHLVRFCVACNDGCIYQVMQEKGVRCIHNPGAGREATMSERLVSKAASSRQVVVVGGGPAGLKTAETAARRGHRVTLIESGIRLGGLVNLAALQPEHASLAEVTSYLEAVIQDLGVKVRLGTQGTPDAISTLNPDIVVIATGSEPNLPGRASPDTNRSLELGLQILPEVEGFERDTVVSVDEVLSGRVKPSGHVVVIDANGHWEAAGTAEFLADMGCRVTVIAGHVLVGDNIEAGTRTLFYRRAAIKGMTLRPSTRIVEVKERSVIVSPVFSAADAVGWGKYLLMPGDEEEIADVDWVVPVMGRRSREGLFLELSSSERFRDVRLERVGDCVVPRLIQATIAEAFELGREL